MWYTIIVENNLGFVGYSDRGYPIYELDCRARCFKCNELLVNTGLDRFTGHRSGYCCNCHMTTSYDLPEERLHFIYNEMMGHQQGYRIESTLTTVVE